MSTLCDKLQEDENAQALSSRSSSMTAGTGVFIPSPSKAFKDSSLRESRESSSTPPASPSRLRSSRGIRRPKSSAVLASNGSFTATTSPTGPSLCSSHPGLTYSHHGHDAGGPFFPIDFEAAAAGGGYCPGHGLPRLRESESSLPDVSFFPFPTSYDFGALVAAASSTGVQGDVDVGSGARAYLESLETLKRIAGPAFYPLLLSQVASLEDLNPGVPAAPALGLPSHLAQPQPVPLQHPLDFVAFGYGHGDPMDLMEKIEGQSITGALQVLLGTAGVGPVQVHGQGQGGQLHGDRSMNGISVQLGGGSGGGSGSCKGRDALCDPLLGALALQPSQQLDRTSSAPSIGSGLGNASSPAPASSSMYSPSQAESPSGNGCATGSPGSAPSRPASVLGQPKVRSQSTTGEGICEAASGAALAEEGATGEARPRKPRSAMEEAEARLKAAVREYMETVTLISSPDGIKAPLSPLSRASKTGEPQPRPKVIKQAPIPTAPATPLTIRSRPYNGTQSPAPPPPPPPPHPHMDFMHRPKPAAAAWGGQMPSPQHVGVNSTGAGLSPTGAGFGSVPVQPARGPRISRTLTPSVPVPALVKSIASNPPPPPPPPPPPAPAASNYNAILTPPMLYSGKSGGQQVRPGLAIGTVAVAASEARGWAGSGHGLALETAEASHISRVSHPRAPRLSGGVRISPTPGTAKGPQTQNHRPPGIQVPSGESHASTASLSGSSATPRNLANTLSV